MSLIPHIVAAFVGVLAAMLLVEETKAIANKLVRWCVVFVGGILVCVLLGWFLDLVVSAFQRVGA